MIGDILIVRNEPKLGRLNGLLPGQRVIVREFLFKTYGVGTMLRVEPIEQSGNLYSIYDCFLKTTQELRDEKIDQILGSPPEDLRG
jgi:hypothetical protein